ncbi:MAG: hypothetical protein JWO38_6718 [Gemmataceae bacterium]|nr:hypothetical protein [Gemmataceae bacterium]
MFGDAFFLAESVLMDSGHTPVMGDDDREQARALSLHGVRPPVKVPGYEQEAFIGKGAYGEVWVAVDSNSGRKVAIKYYTRRGGTDWAALAREVEKLRYLFNDRYVVQLFKVGWEAEPPYYVMEYMENGSLEDLLRHRALTVHDAVTLFRDVARGLVHAHDKGILHCDLKPANILLDYERRPRLADFGQSRLTNEISPALGTLFYMAPEQADLKAVPDARWDVYALGAVMYRMLTGHPPHRDRTEASAVVGTGPLDGQLAAYRHLIETSPPPAAHYKVAGVDAGLAAVVSKCLAANPRNRYPNPQAALSALEGWELHRVRRPLMVLTGMGFTALLVVMAAIGFTLFRDTVSTAGREVVEEATEGNRFAAKAAAERLAVQTQYRWQILEHEARDPQLRVLLEMPPDEFRKRAAGDELDTWLGRRKTKYDPQFDEDGRARLWFADTRGGSLYGTAPPAPQQRFRYLGFRDYFHGQGRDLEKKIGPAPPPVTRPYRSLVFRRVGENQEEYLTVAFTVPVWASDAKPGEPVGVLGMNLDLKGQTRVDGDRERFAVLVDTRADATGRRGLIIRHPYLEQARDAAAGPELTLHYADEVVRWADAGKPEFAAEQGYLDPVGGKFATPWLASPERVVVRLEGGLLLDTGWVVVVQERRADVLAPVRDLQWRLGYGAAAALMFVLVLILVMWAGMMSVVDATSSSRITRFMRRWAGLPIATSSTRTAGADGPGSGGSTTGRSIAVAAEPTAVGESKA